jgi:hypothetical protein
MTKYTVNCYGPGLFNELGDVAGVFKHLLGLPCLFTRPPSHLSDTPNQGWRTIGTEWNISWHLSLGRTIFLPQQHLQTPDNSTVHTAVTICDTDTFRYAYCFYSVKRKIWLLTEDGSKKKIGKMYSLEYTDISKVFFTVHHVGRCCTVIRGRCCTEMPSGHCCANAEVTVAQLCVPTTGIRFPLLRNNDPWSCRLPSP